MRSRTAVGSNMAAGSNTAMRRDTVVQPGAGMLVRRQVLGAAVVLMVLTTAIACVPRPPVDTSARDGSYGIVIERNVAVRLTDGRVMRVDVYRPTDPSTGTIAPGEFPVILGITPYGKSMAVDAPGLGGVNLDLVRNGYIAVVADNPGTGVSDGRFTLFSPDEATAGVELVRWAAGIDGSSGNVGMIGHSYSAINQMFAAAGVGPGSPLRAIFPMSPTIDAYRDLYVSGGALNVMSPLGLLFGYGVTRSITPLVEAGGDLAMALAYATANAQQMNRFEAVMADHMINNGPRRYFDEFWAEREVAPLLQRIVDNGVAVHLLGGLYDVFQRGVPLIYSGLQNASVGRDVYAPMTSEQTISPMYRMTFGPWTHAGMADWKDLTATQLAWFDHWLKGIDDPTMTSYDPIHVIEPGGATYDAATYPLTGATVERFWLRPDGQLSDRPDPTVGTTSTERIDYTGIGEGCSASTVQFAAGIDAERCLKPKRKSTRSTGEITYSTGPLAEDMRLAGPIGLTLRAESTRPDSFFAVTIEDVAPDGRSTDITGGDQLGSLRALHGGPGGDHRSWPSPTGDSFILPYLDLTRSARTPVPIGEVVRYDIEVRPAFATIPAGHRLRVRISTADFPHMIPLGDLSDLFGGVYTIHYDGPNHSFIDISTNPDVPSRSVDPAAG